VHGYAKQGAAYGYSGVKGLNLQLAAISTPVSAPVIAQARLRAGNTASAAGAARLVAQAVTTIRRAGVTGQVLARADSAYYGWAFVGAALKADAWFSVTARMTPTVTAAIAGIAEPAWIPIRYPHAVYDHDEDRYVSDAEVAETSFTAFTGRRRSEQVTCRLVVRRVRRLQPRTSDGSVQGELFATYRHHAFITNSTLTTIAADERHRDHAIIEQVIAELKDGPLAHLPSGKYAANAAWTTCAVIAFNLARAAAVAADLATIRWASLRTKIINMAGASPRPAAAWTCTSLTAGPANPAGNASGPSRPARHPCDPLDRQPRRAPSRTRSGRAGQTGSITTPSNKSI